MLLSQPFPADFLHYSRHTIEGIFRRREHIRRSCRNHLVTKAYGVLQAGKGNVLADGEDHIRGVRKGLTQQKNTALVADYLGEGSHRI